MSKFEENRMSNDQWSSRGLPDNLSGLSFIEIGCWEGDYCVEAKRRGAKQVVGVDYCTSPLLIKNLQSETFTFIQLDILSNKSLQLPQFDVVYSAGVLYHLEDPLGFLFRLRNLAVTGGVLIVETTCYFDAGSLPVMLYHPNSDFDANPSNWWSPNESCLIEMLSQSGFRDSQVVFRSPPPTTGTKQDRSVGRICIRATACQRDMAHLEKLLPRRPSFMPQSAGAGNRADVK